MKGEEISLGCTHMHTNRRTCFSLWLAIWYGLNVYTDEISNIFLLCFGVRLNLLLDYLLKHKRSSELKLSVIKMPRGKMY